MNLVMLTRGGSKRRCDACIRGQEPLRPKNHHSDRIIWLQAFCFVQRNMECHPVTAAGIQAAERGAATASFRGSR